MIKFIFVLLWQRGAWLLLRLETEIVRWVRWFVFRFSWISHTTHTHVCTLTWLLTNSHRSHTFINMIISNNHSVNVNLLNIWHVCWTLFLVQAVLHYSGISRCSYRRDTRNTNDKEEQSLADDPPGTPQIWRALTSVVTDRYAPLSALSGDIGSASFATFVAPSAYYSTL